MFVTISGKLMAVKTGQLCSQSASPEWLKHRTKVGDRRLPSEEKKPLGRHRYGWEDDIKTNLKETECGLNSYGPMASSSERGNDSLGCKKGGNIMRG